MFQLVSLWAMRITAWPFLILGVVLAEVAEWSINIGAWLVDVAPEKEVR